MQLTGKTILLTGATGGIGKAIAQSLAKAGAKLILTGRNAEKLAAIKVTGTTPICVCADLTNANDRARLVVIAEQHKLDILINNAGINNLAQLSSTTDAQLAQMLETNLLTPMLLCKALLPVLHKSASPAIVNIGSTLGSIGFAGSTGYCASKFGLRGFTEALRRELADSLIKVIYFAPRATATSINSDQANALNEALGNAVDSPETVATALLATLTKGSAHNYYHGWPEKLFVRLNGVLPKLVDGALKKQLATIKRFAQ